MRWFFALVLATLVGFAPGLFDGENYWYASVVCRDVIIVLVSWAAFLSVPYSKTWEKIGWAIWTGWQMAILISQVLEYIMDPSWSSVWSTFSVLSAIAFISLIFSKKPFQRASIVVDKGMVYYVLWPVENLRGLLFSILTHPWDGVSVYANSTYYGFSITRGFIKRTGKIAENIIKTAELVPVRPTTPGDIKYLESLIGTQWRPWRNCYTVFRRQFGSLTDALEKQNEPRT